MGYNMEYDISKCEVSNFFIVSEKAINLNAQDVLHTLISQAKNLTILGGLQFSDEVGSKVTCDVNPQIIVNLLWDIQTKLELMEKSLEVAFK